MGARVISMLQIQAVAAGLPRVMTTEWAGERLVSEVAPLQRNAPASGGADDLSRLLCNFGVQDAAFEAALRYALRTGRALDARSQDDGARLNASARPNGRRMKVTFHVNPGGEDSLDLAHAARSAPFPLWLRGPGGDLRWRNVACDSVGLNLCDPRLAAAAATARADNAAQTTRIAGTDGQMLAAIECPSGLGVASPAPAAETPDLQDAAAAAMENSAHGVAIFGLGRRLLYANRAVAGLWRIPEEKLDEPLRFEDILDAMRADGRLPVVANFALWREEVAEWADPTADAPDEDDWSLSDGSVIRLSRSVDSASRTYLSFQDITRQVALERRYLRKVGIQRRTLDALESGVALFDADGRLRLINPAFAQLWSLDPARARVSAHISEIAAPEGGAAKAAWSALCNAVTGGGRVAPCRFDLSGRVLETSTVRMPDGATLARIDDRTAAARVEDALRERSEALQDGAELRARLTDCASVRLRTALTSLSGFAELLAMEADERDGDGPLESILEATADMARAITEIERLASAEGTVGESALSASELLSATAELLARPLWSAEAQLDCADQGGDAIFPGDADSLRQIALSMALAVLDVTPQGGAIRLSAAATPVERGGDAVLSAATSDPNGRLSEARLSRIRRLADRVGAAFSVVESNSYLEVRLESAGD